MMLLIGIKMSFTKKPTNPITTNPMAVRTATFVNSTNKITIQNQAISHYNVNHGSLHSKHTDLHTRENKNDGSSWENDKNIQIAHA